MTTVLFSLETENLACIRGQRMLFRELGFRLAAGAALTVEGPNGVGKTSLLRMLAGFIAPAAGTIRLQTANAGVVLAPEDRGQWTGFLGHRDALKPQLTVYENLQFFARLYRMGDEMGAALEWAGLARVRDLPGQFLSAGQKKRVALARLKLCARPLWLLDEPLAALDSAGKALVAGMIAQHCADGGMAVVATHEPLGLDTAKLILDSA